MTEWASKFEPRALEGLRCLPQFPDAMRMLAREAASFGAEIDPAGRWLLQDIGRGAIYMAALILNGLAVTVPRTLPGGLTAATLVRASMANGTASRGRVEDFVLYALNAREMSLAPGPLHWTQRPLTLLAPFTGRMRRRARIDTAAVARLDPDLAPLLPRLEEERFFNAFWLWTGVIADAQPSVTRGPPSPTMVFLERRSGMNILFHVIADQEQGPLAQEGPLDRAAFPRLYAVSHTHVGRMLRDAEQRGLMAFPAPGRVRVLAPLAEDLAATYSLTLQIVCSALRAAAQMTGVALEI